MAPARSVQQRAREGGAFLAWPGTLTHPRRAASRGRLQAPVRSRWLTVQLQPETPPRRAVTRSPLEGGGGRHSRTRGRSQSRPARDCRSRSRQRQDRCREKQPKWLPSPRSKRPSRPFRLPGPTDRRGAALPRNVSGGEKVSRSNRLLHVQNLSITAISTDRARWGSLRTQVHSRPKRIGNRRQRGLVMSVGSAVERGTQPSTATARSESVPPRRALSTKPGRRGHRDPFLHHIGAGTRIPAPASSYGARRPAKLHACQLFASECGRLSGTSGKPLRKITSWRWLTYASNTNSGQ